MNQQYADWQVRLLNRSMRRGYAWSSLCVMLGMSPAELKAMIRFVF